MKTPRHSRRKQSEAGIALLIAIFALMLISAVAISLIVASGSESSLAGNYRSSTSAYYAGFAGLEEARGRVLPKNPNYLDPLAGLGGLTYLPVGTLRYITNPAPGELPGLALLATYPDNEYNSEGMGAWAAAIKLPTNSVWTPLAAATPGPMYKWVRINAATERSLNIDVNGGGLDPNNIPLYYDSALTPPSLIVPPVLAGVPQPPPTARQALEVTALAVLPNGSQKMVQYVIAASIYDLTFPSALTLTGQVATFSGASSNQYFMNGIDGSGNPPPVPGCNPNQKAVSAIGVSSPTDEQYVENNLPRPSHYVTTDPSTGGTVTGTQAVTTVSLNSNLQTPAGLYDLLFNPQTGMYYNADKVIPDPTTTPLPPDFNNSGTTYNFGGPGWPTDMSATNPKVVFVDGSFDLGPNTGYGILVVTGNFIYHGNSGWKGIVLVIGDGNTVFDGLGGGNQEFDGAVYVASIWHDDSGRRKLNDTLGKVNFNASGGGGNGIYYNSCWIEKSKQPLSYLALSFREIPQ